MNKEQLKARLISDIENDIDAAILLQESINHPPSETIQMETMTLNKEQESAIMQAKVDRLTTQLIAELVEQLEKIGATEDTPIRCLGNKPLSELKEWIEEEEDEEKRRQWEETTIRRITRVNKR